MKKGIYIGIVILLLVVFGVSAFMVGSYYLEGHKQAEKFDQLSQIKEESKTPAVKETVDPTDPAETTQPPQVRNADGMLLEYVDLYNMNNDMVGWIKIEGTEVDYPVMQTPDTVDYYLKRDFDEQHSERGCIYVREVCDVMEPSDNQTIYGHTMLDGSMFADLHKYIDKEKWEENPLIIYDTLYDYHVYKIFAVFKTTASIGQGFKYHQMVDAENEADFDKFIGTCKDLAFYDTGITPKYGDKVICLSTCEYTLENGRLVVAAVRIY